jgi:ferredoxin-NADP reductase
VIDVHPQSIATELDRARREVERRERTRERSDRPRSAAADEDAALRRLRAPNRDQLRDVDALAPEPCANRAADLVVANRPDEERADAEPRQGDGRCRRRASARDVERRRDDPVVRGGVPRNLDDRVERCQADADDVRQGATLLRLSGT